MVPSGDAAVTGGRTERHRDEPQIVELVAIGGPVALRLLEGPEGQYLLAGSRESRWPAALGRDGLADLRQNGRVERVHAVVVRDIAERAQVLGRARERYGDLQFETWFPDPGSLFRLGGVGSAPSRPYVGWLADEFDRLAGSYGDQIERNPIERYLRAQSLHLLRRRLRGARRLLEIGGGVGLETIPMLEEGHEVTVVDVSSGMLEVLRERARKAGVAERLTTRVGALGSLAALPDLGPFDGAWSTFGAVNCEPDLRPAADGLALHLRPGAPLVLAVLNRWAVLEMLGYAGTFRFARAGARLGPTLRVGASRFSIDCHPYSTAEVERALRPRFRPESEIGLLVVLPPPDWVAGRRVAPSAWAALERVDRRAGRLWPFRYWGDHVMLTFVRAASGAGGGAA